MITCAICYNQSLWCLNWHLRVNTLPLLALWLLLKNIFRLCKVLSAGQAGLKQADPAALQLDAVGVVWSQVSSLAVSSKEGDRSVKKPDTFIRGLISS